MFGISFIDSNGSNMQFISRLFSEAKINKATNAASNMESLLSSSFSVKNLELMRQGIRQSGNANAIKRFDETVLQSISKPSLRGDNSSFFDFFG